MCDGNSCAVGPLTPVLGSTPWGWFLAFAWRHGDFYARAAIRRYVVGTIRLKKMPPTWAARLEEATMVDEAQLSKAVAALTAGKPVVFPTDTVYGIGIAVGLACSPEAIFIDKRRDPDKAIPWLVGSPAALTRYGRDVSQLAHDMVSQFWPGPLTLVVKAGDNVPEAFRGANDTIALRMPNDSVALELIERVGFPLATSSANFQGKKPPQTLADVDPEFAAQVPVVLGDDVPRSGVSSTIVDCTHEHPHILRVGALAADDFKELL